MESAIGFRSTGMSVAGAVDDVSTSKKSALPLEFIKRTSGLMPFGKSDRHEARVPLVPSHDFMVKPSCARTGVACANEYAAYMPPVRLAYPSNIHVSVRCRNREHMAMYAERVLVPKTCPANPQRDPSSLRHRASVSESGPFSLGSCGFRPPAGDGRSTRNAA